MSSSGEDAIPVGGKKFVFSPRDRKTVSMNADVTAALKLVFENDGLEHVLAKSRTGNVAAEENSPVGRLISPFVKEVGEASLTACVAFGGSGRSSCGNRSAGRRRRRSRGSRGSWRTKKVEAKMCFCLQEKDLLPNIKATGSGARKRRDNTRRR